MATTKGTTVSYEVVRVDGKPEFTIRKTTTYPGGGRDSVFMGVDEAGLWELHATIGKLLGASDMEWRTTVGDTWDSNPKPPDGLGWVLHSSVFDSDSGKVIFHWGRRP